MDSSSQSFTATFHLPDENRVDQNAARKGLGAWMQWADIFSHLRFRSTFIQHPAKTVWMCTSLCEFPPVERFEKEK